MAMESGRHPPSPRLATHRGALSGFNITDHFRAVCADIVARLEEFSHIDLTRVAIRGCQARAPGPYGMQASLTPLRFQNGALETIRRGRRYRVQPIVAPDGREMLYLLSFYLPRFQDQSFEEKVATMCHELWHISPAFDGDIRRHDHGRCYAHGPSEKAYHAAMHELAERWLAHGPAESLCAPLRLGFQSLQANYGTVFGLRMATPKLALVRDAPRER